MQDPLVTPLFLMGVNVAFGLEAAAGSVAIVAGGVTVSTGGIASVLSAATIIGASVAVNYAMQPDVPKPEQAFIPLRQTVPPRICGAGEVRLAGNYVLYEIGAAGLSCDVLALCQGPVGGYKQFFMDDHTTFVNTDGRPNSGVWGNFAYMATLIYANKGALQNAAWVPAGLSGIWTADHRGDGVASLMLQCSNIKQADFLKFYPHGLPKPSAAMFLPCWDFRDSAQTPDDLNSWVNYQQYNSGAVYNVGDRVLNGGMVVPGVGAPGGMLWLCRQNGTMGVEPSNLTAPHWSPVWKNPVLQVVTYLTSQTVGMGLPPGRIITPALASLTAQAAICDEPVERSNGLWEPRYASNIWWKLETEPAEVLGQMLAACDGWLSIDGEGALAMRVGVFEPPTVTLDESLILSVEVNYGATDEEKVDELTLTYTSPEHGYSTQAVESWRDENAILNRGKVRAQAFGPAAVHSASQVRRLAKRIFLRNNSIRGSISTHLGGMIAAGQRYVQLNYPLIPELNGVAIELRRRTTDLAARQCHFEFVVVDPELLDGWQPDVDEGEPAPTPLPPLAPGALPIPQDVEAVEDAGPPFAVLVSWDDLARPDLDYRVRYRITGTADWSQQTFTDLVAVGGRITVPLYLDSVTDYQIQVASVGTSGSESAYSDSVYIGGTVVTGQGTASGTGTAAAASSSVRSAFGTATGTGSANASAAAAAAARDTSMGIGRGIGTASTI